MFLLNNVSHLDGNLNERLGKFKLAWKIYNDV